MIVLKQSTNQKFFLNFSSKPDLSADAEYHLKNRNGQELQTGTVTLYTYDLTTSQLAGRTADNTDIVTVAGTTDLVLGPAFITSTNGAWELTEIIGIDSDTLELTLKRPLNGVYPVGSSITPARCYVSFSDTNLTIAEDIILQFSYKNINGEVDGYQESGYIHPSPSGNPARLEEYWDNFPSLRTTAMGRQDPTAWARILEQSFQDVREKLWQNELKIEQIKGATGKIKSIIYAKLSMHILKNGISIIPNMDGAEQYNLFMSEYESDLTELLNGKQWIDIDEDEVEDSDEKGAPTTINWGQR